MDPTEDPQVVVDSIFDQFVTRCVPRWDNTPEHGMYYWGTAPGGFTTDSLLEDEDKSGKCGAWARFFRDCIKTQGISGAIMLGYERPMLGFNFDLGFDTKAAPSAADPQSGLLWVKPGIQAQDNQTPKRDFSDGHGMTEYVSKLYDPSYGKIYTGADRDARKLDWVVKSVEKVDWLFGNKRGGVSTGQKAADSISLNVEEP